MYTVYPQVESLLVSDSLPPSYAEDASEWFLPLADELLQRIQSNSRQTTVLGISGAQGTGKSTLAKLLTLIVESRGYRVANLSLDDFYLGKAARVELARTRHPLFRTRGVPGTHDTALLSSTISQLRAADNTSSVRIPRFDKASDDRLPEFSFDNIEGPVELVILEGWFVGATAQLEEELSLDMNALEREADRDGRWRAAVNDSLATDYQPIFAELDLLVMLRAPTFEQVYEWRGLQERKLAARRGAGSAVMNEAELQRFIQHYERLTRHCLATLPDSADIVFQLDAGHRVVSRSDKAG
jgi:D-glycerate 3-kinase